MNGLDAFRESRVYFLPCLDLEFHGVGNKAPSSKKERLFLS